MLAKALSDPDAEVRRTVVAYVDFQEFSDFSEETLELLLRALAHEDAATRKTAATALGRAGSKSKRVIAALENAAEDKDPWVRNSVHHALWELTHEWDRYVRHLLEMVHRWDRSFDKPKGQAKVISKKEQSEIYSNGYFRLFKIGLENPEKLTAVLVKFFSDASPTMRALAVKAFDDMMCRDAEKMKTFLKELQVDTAIRKLLDDPDSSVRWQARQVLKRFAD